MEMKIAIAQGDYAFSLLTKGHLLSRKKSEPWQEVDPEVEQLKRAYYDDYTPIELPYPLDGARLYLGTIGETYHMEVVIFKRDEKAFKNLSSRLVRKFGRVGRLFVPSEDDGAGYVGGGGEGELREVSAVIAPNKSDNGRIISIGGYGAYERIVKDSVSFTEDLGELESLTNAFIDTCLQPFAKKSPSIRKMSNSTLYFVP